jgi:hypothetical protein
LNSVWGFGTGLFLKWFGVTPFLGDEQALRAELRWLQAIFLIMVREAPGEPGTPQRSPYPADKARGGEIIRNRHQRMIFAGGLIAAIVLALLLCVFAAFFA